MVFAILNGPRPCMVVKLLYMTYKCVPCSIVTHFQTKFKDMLDNLFFLYFFLLFFLQIPRL